jgi:hypothetical protein
MALLRGAFLKFGGGMLGLPDIIVFQFNPETVTRTPSLQQTDVTASTASWEDPRQVLAAPTESFSFTLRLDATDQLAAKNPIAKTSGILPALSAIEMLMYPVAPQSSLLTIVSGDGASYSNPPNVLPSVLFFWGPSRLLPVNVTALSITEMEYDMLLNPTRAEVSVTLQVISPPALDATDELMRGAYMYTQTVKQAMAAANLANSAELAAPIAVSF